MVIGTMAFSQYAMAETDSCSYIELEEGDQTANLKVWLNKHRNDQCMAIYGKGIGITRIMEPVHLNAWYPTVVGLTIAPPEDDQVPNTAALRLQNAGGATLRDIEILAPRNGSGLKVITDTPCMTTDPATDCLDHPFQVNGRYPLSYEQRTMRSHSGVVSNFRIVGHGKGIVIIKKTGDEYGRWLNYWKFMGGTIQTEDVAFTTQGSFNHEFHGVDITADVVMDIQYEQGQDGGGNIHWYGRAPEVKDKTSGHIAYKGYIENIIINGYKNVTQSGLRQVVYEQTSGN
jgi:hypothetical protein